LQLDQADVAIRTPGQPAKCRAARWSVKPLHRVSTEPTQLVSIWLTADRIRQGPLVRIHLPPGKSRTNTDGDCRRGFLSMRKRLRSAQHGERADDDADNAKWDMDTCDYCQEDRIGGWDLDPGWGGRSIGHALRDLPLLFVRLRRGLRRVAGPKVHRTGLPMMAM
jgi:hypothetical protein